MPLSACGVSRLSESNDKFTSWANHDQRLSMAAAVSPALVTILKIVPIIAMLVFLTGDMAPFPLVPKKNHGDRMGSVMKLQRSFQRGTPPMFGSPKFGQDYVVIYNAVPKCGSRTFLSSLNRMSNTHGRDVAHVRSFAKNWTLVHNVVEALNTPGFVSGHLPFLPFNRSNAVYINMIRNPLDRLVSLYYFNINGDAGGWKNQRFLKSMEGMEIETLEEMAAKDGFYQRQPYMTFFTQDDEVHSSNLEEAVKVAKENIERNFVFIGLLEEFEASMKIFEILFPDLMGGLTRAYQGVLADQRWKYKTVDKVTPSNETLRNLMKNDVHLKYEFEIYEFVKKLFYQTKRRLL